MKKHHLYLYLTLSIIMMIGAIVLFVFDQSPMYYSWPLKLFTLASFVAVISLVIGILYLNKKSEPNEHALNTIEWFRFLSMSLMIILIVFMYFISSATVFQNSMNPTLENSDVVLIYHYTYTPKRGDIIIIDVHQENYPNHSGEPEYYVKRVYGCPGDTVTFQYVSQNAYKILINGEIVTNEYGEEYYAEVNTNMVQMVNPSYSEKDVIEEALDENHQIKEGRYLVFGDNQDNSVDSRDLGGIYKEDIVGKVIFRLSPFGGIS